MCNNTNQILHPITISQLDIKKVASQQVCGLPIQLLIYQHPYEKHVTL